MTGDARQEPAAPRAGVTSPAGFSLALDARRWGRTGLGRYQSELYRALRVAAPRVQLTFAGGDAAAVAAATLGARHVPYRARLYSPREQLLGGTAMRAAGADLYHFPHYAVPVWAPRPYVVTVLDLIHFRFPDQFGKAKVAIARLVLRRAVERAARVVCISEATRRDLLAVVPAAEDKLDVVALGVSDDFRPAAPGEVASVMHRHGLTRYVLSMGDREAYKRHDVVVKAFEWLHARDAGLRLAVVGERGPDAGPDPPGVVRLGYVSDDDLRALYTGAGCLIFPSAYEGFGLPPLEAMACGCPVVCGRGSALDEVCAGAARQVNAAEPTEVADAVALLLSDDATREDAVARGLERARGLRWDVTARRSLDVFTRALGR